MSPTEIVSTSVRKGLDIIAICDHNSCENAGAVLRACSGSDLHVFPGMEINSLEEAHVLAIFDTEEQAVEMQEVIYNKLEGSNNPDIFGEQIVVNESDEVEYFNSRFLIGSVKMGINEIVKEAHQLGGICIASHIDKPSYSIISQLGFIPDDLPLDALEISANFKGANHSQILDGDVKLPAIRSSDAHFREDIGRAFTLFYMETPSVEELKLAFKGAGGRRVET